MSFAAAWVFAGFVLLIPLVLLHLRQRGRVVREVPSLLLWEEIVLADAQGARGLRRPPLPLLLALQALALVLLLLALAQPRSPAAKARGAQVIVLDDSWEMQAPGRIAQAKREVERVIAADRGVAQVAIVLAASPPRVLYRGGGAGARAALAQLSAGGAPADISAALTVAAGLLDSAQDSVVLVRARADPAPAVLADARELHTITLSGAVEDEGIFGAGARCGIGATSACEVSATVRNTAAHAVLDSVIAQAAGRPPLTLRVRVGARASTPLTLASQPGQQVSLRLQHADELPADDEAWVSVPAAGDLPTSSVVTLVGEPAVALATARAFAAVPGAQLRLRTRATFRRAEAARSSLLILDHWVPAGGIPPSPAVLLIDPPRLPEGHVGASLPDAAVSGSDASSVLLAGVELSALAIDPGAARTLEPPPWLAPVVWSPEGVLLAAGDDGAQRIAALSFEPGQSDLPQLAALPILAANFVQWASGWAPASASAGIPFAVDATRGVRLVSLARAGKAIERVRVERAPVALALARPGSYTVRESGPGLLREAKLAVNTSEALPAGPAPVDLRAARAGSGSKGPVNRAPWFLAAALLALALEWLYWLYRGRPGLRWAR